MKLVLDTCTFLWIALGDASLSKRAEKLATDESNEVFLSAASVWEIAVKHQLGKLVLPRPPATLIPEARARLRIAALPIDERVALAIGQLPSIHRDPFDRLIVAQALVEGLTILTPDPKIRKYPVPTQW